MTALLQKAFAKLQRLPEAEQDHVAVMILAQVEHGDSAWDRSFAESQDMLAMLADEAIAERKRGETEPLDINRM